MKRQVTIRCLLIVVATIILLGGPVRGQQVRQLFFDDFSDGDAQDCSPIPWWWDAARGDVAVVDGGLWMQPKVGKPDLLAFAPEDIYRDDLQKYAGDLVVTVQFTATPCAGSAAGIFLRMNLDMHNKDLVALDGSGYVGGIGAANDLYLVRFDGSPSSMKYLGGNRFPNFDIRSEDIILQLGISDYVTPQGARSSRIELRAWRPGEEMPTQPQISATDSQYSEGYAGFCVDSGDSAPGLSDATVRWIEFVGEHSEPVVDFNGDGNVDINDLLRLIESWGQADPICDIAPRPYGDGTVDATDLELLMSYWEQPVDDPTLMAHWALDETEGGAARDSISGDDAVVLGDPVWLPAGGQVNGALELDGVDDCVVAAFALNPLDGPFSVSAWIKGGAAGQVVISEAAGPDWLCLDPVTGNLMTALSSTGLSGSALLSNSRTDDGDWHRVGLVWDGLYRTLCVDGVSVAQDTQEGLKSLSRDLYIGAGNAMVLETGFRGLIDDVRIYNRAVSP